MVRPSIPHSYRIPALVLFYDRMVLTNCRRALLPARTGNISSLRTNVQCYFSKKLAALKKAAVEAESAAFAEAFAVNCAWSSIYEL